MDRMKDKSKTWIKACPCKQGAKTKIKSKSSGLRLKHVPA